MSAPSSSKLHVHFDCFSGAAGDMLLASLLDYGGDRLLEKVTASLKSIPDICFQDEWKLGVSQVWRSKGSISATKVDVQSKYMHRSAPVPKPASSQEQTSSAAQGHDDHNHSHDHDHGHSHSHGHSHDHGSSSPSSNAADDHHLRNLPSITALIRNSPLPQWVKDASISAFTHLAAAESETHGSTLHDVHFHEVGAVDSLVDTLGVFLCLHHLNCVSFSSSPLPLSSGAVRTEHGLLPVPAPATLRLLQGFVVVPGPPGRHGELVTPTGAAILRALTGDGGALPSRMRVVGVGIGAGTKDFEGHPNILRAVLGTVADVDGLAAKGGAVQAPAAAEKREVDEERALKKAEVGAGGEPTSRGSEFPPAPPNSSTPQQSTFSPAESSSNPLYVWSELSELSCNVDDMTGEVIAYVIERAMSLGALDAWATPIIMKKGRPAHTLHFLLDEGARDKVDAVTDMVFRETTTLGIRVGTGIKRAALKRDFVRGVQTPYSNAACDGKVDVKIGLIGGEVITVHPEFDDCKKVAIATGAPLKDVIEAAKQQVTLFNSKSA